MWDYLLAVLWWPGGCAACFVLAAGGHWWLLWTWIAAAVAVAAVCGYRESNGPNISSASVDQRTTSSM